MNRRERNLLRISRYKAANATRDPYDSQESKICYRCRLDLPRTSYVRDSTKRDGLQSYCRECARKNRIEATYGITHEEFLVLLEKQHGCCAICKNNFEASGITPNIDHCHSSGAVRGLLCASCNKGLGNFNDNAALLERALDYLGEFE